MFEETQGEQGEDDGEQLYWNTLEFLYALQKTTRWTVVLQNLLNDLARRRTQSATWRHPERYTSFLECTLCKMKMVKMSIHLQHPMICKKTQHVRKACVILRSSKDSPADQVDERINNILNSNLD